MKYIYWTYRSKRITNPFNLTDWVTLNGVYSPSFFINNMFSDWQEAWLTKLIDDIIPEDRYTWEVIPWVKKLTRFLMFEYNETYVDPLELERSAENIWKEFDIAMQDVETIRQWLRDNTNLEEVETWKFLINPESTWLIDWEIVPAQYLIIE